MCADVCVCTLYTGLQQYKKRPFIGHRGVREKGGYKKHLVQEQVL